MCIYYAIPVTATGMLPAPILHTGAKIGEKISFKYAYTTGHTGSIPENPTLSLQFAEQPVISAPNESFERIESPVDIQQPAPRVIDYWFDQLGLSANPIASENPSNATSSPFQFPILDGIIYVSSLYVVRPPLDLFMFCGGF